MAERLGEGPEGDIADAEATQCPDTVSPFLVETGNGYRLERHIHTLAALCETHFVRQDRGRSGKVVLLPRSRA